MTVTKFINLYSNNANPVECMAEYAAMRTEETLTEIITCECFQEYGESKQREIVRKAISEMHNAIDDVMGRYLN